MTQHDLFESTETTVNLSPYGKLEPTDKVQTCPCCDQLVKLYKMTMPIGAVADIKEYVLRNETSDWIHINDLRTRSQGGEIARLRHWGLVEEMPNYDASKRTAGMWRVTLKGRDFVTGKSMCNKYAKLYNQTFYGFDGDMVTVDDVLKDRFNFAELMAR